MPKRATYTAPQIEVKIFSAEDINRGIEKLKRRIADVDALEAV